MDTSDHSRRLELLCRKYAGGQCPSGLVDRPPFTSGLTAPEEQELRDLEGLLSIAIRRLWPK